MSKSGQNQSFETTCIHAGAKPCPETGARVPPIHQSVAYVFEDAQHGADLFGLRRGGYIYSRINNTTVAALEEKLTALEDGIGATCTASGLAAQMIALFSLMSAGDEFVASKRLYGGTISQFTYSFKRAFGWNCVLVDPDDTDNFKRAITPKTRAIFMESLANPGGVVTDIEAVAKIAHDAGLPLIIDNTMATAYLCRPKDFGADIVTHSTTKFLSGHGHAMGGAVIDLGTFKWAAHADRFPALAQPDPAYHGLNFAETFGDMALAVHNHAGGLKDLGAGQQPMNAFLTLIGIETLHLRMERHCKNALEMAQYLERHPKVDWVNYSGLPSSPYNALAKKYMKGQGGAVFTFGVKGGREAAQKVAENTKIFSHLANIGDTRSLIIHPPSTTHSPLTADQLTATGIKPETLRVSIGLENVEDLKADLDQALN